MYLDPGFGGMLLQVLIVIAAMGGAILFSLRKKIKNFFAKKKDDNDNINTTVDTLQATNDSDIIDVLDDDK